MKLEVEIKDDAQLNRIHILQAYLAYSPDWKDIIQNVDFSIE